MRSARNMWLLITLLGVILPSSLQAAPNEALLAGTVKSASGQKMGGVTVSAKLDGGTITMSVFTDDQGNYYFPPVQPGKYDVWAQADSYETAHGAADLSGKTHQAFVMKPMKDFAKQLTGDQILSALPEDTADDRRMKQVFRNNCTGCHQPNYILQNRFDEQGWSAIITLMKQISLVTVAPQGEDHSLPIIQFHQDELAKYLAKMRGPGSSPMKFNLRPRPAGEAARTVIYEYDVPTSDRGEPPTNDGSDWALGTPSSLNGNRGTHDAAQDLDQNIWIANSAPSVNHTVMKVDIKTGKVTEFPLPGKGEVAAGSHGIVRDAKGMMWFNVSGASDVEGAPGRLAKLDPATNQIEMFSPPKGMMGVGGTLDTDNQGHVWATTNDGSIRFDPNTKEFLAFKSPTYKNADGVGNTYGMAADREGNPWWAQMAIDIVDKGDVETGKVFPVKIPDVSGQRDLITPEERKLYESSGSDWNSAVPWTQGPRRLGGDKNGNVVWVCDWWGGNLAEIDIHSLKVIKLVPLPRNMQPYEATVDKNHNVWVNLMNADEIARYNPKTSTWTEFPLPTLGTENRWVSLLERDGQLQVVVPYYRTSKVARLVFRTPEEIQAIRKQVETQEQAQAK